MRCVHFETRLDGCRVTPCWRCCVRVLTESKPQASMVRKMNQDSKVGQDATWLSSARESLLAMIEGSPALRVRESNSRSRRFARAAMCIRHGLMVCDASSALTLRAAAAAQTTFQQWWGRPSAMAARLLPTRVEVPASCHRRRRRRRMAMVAGKTRGRVVLCGSRAARWPHRLGYWR